MIHEINLLKLLIIDDDMTTRVLIRGMLDDTDVQIIESGCGKQAFEIFKKQQKKIGLILLDICLPGCDGWTLFGKIRHSSPLVPVIAISAMPPVELEAKCYTTGFTGYFSKPFDIDRHKEIILSYLQFRNIA